MGWRKENLRQKTNKNKKTQRVFVVVFLFCFVLFYGHSEVYGNFLAGVESEPQFQLTL